MPLWVHIVGWCLVVLNTLCLIRLGILPVIFFWKNYALYQKAFWASILITFIFTFSQVMLVSIMLTLN